MCRLKMQMEVGTIVRVLKERRKAKVKAKAKESGGAGAGRGRGRGRGGASRVGERGGKTTSASVSAPASTPTLGHATQTSSSNPTNPNPMIPVLITQSTQRLVGDAGSPIVVVDSDDDEEEKEREKEREGPAMKKRRVEVELTMALAMQGIQATRCPCTLYDRLLGGSESMFIA